MRHFAILLTFAAVGANADARPMPQLPTLEAAFLRAPPSSMEPAFPAGALLVLEPLAGAPKRGDSVAVTLSGADESLFALRVVGLPGEQIEFDDGFPVIDGAKQKSIVQWIPPGMTGWASFPKWGKAFKVPDASYYVLADNHSEGAVDSLTHGAVGRASIAGSLSTWDEVRRTPGRMSAVFQRAFRDARSRLPIKSDGLELIDIEVLGDLDLRFTYRGLEPITDLDAGLLQELTCQIDWYRQANGLRLQYRILEGKAVRLEFELEQSACRR